MQQYEPEREDETGEVTGSGLKCGYGDEWKGQNDQRRVNESRTFLNTIRTCQEICIERNFK